MDGQHARLRINLSEREFEVEGSEAFVKAYLERFESWLMRFDQTAEPARTNPSPDTLARPAPRRLEGNSFGELIHHLPRAASDVDRMLLAGYFSYLRSADKSFRTGDANGLLTEQGIKVGNPSQCVRQNLIAKRVFKHQGRYRLSQTGIDYLRQLLGAELPA